MLKAKEESYRLNKIRRTRNIANKERIKLEEKRAKSQIEDNSYRSFSRYMKFLSINNSINVKNTENIRPVTPNTQSCIDQVRRFEAKYKEERQKLKEQTRLQKEEIEQMKVEDKGIEEEFEKNYIDSY